MYSTFRFYNQKGQRLSVIGLVDVEKGITNVRWIAHNKKDIFTRKKGTEILLMNTPLEYPTMTSVNLQGTKFSDFIKFCRNSFLKIKETELEAVKVLSVTKKNRKMDDGTTQKLIIKYLG